MQRIFAIGLFFCFHISLFSQQNIYLSPPLLTVSAEATTVRIGSAGLTGNLTALWNGQKRTSTVEFLTTYVVQLLPGDVAKPQLATITMIDNDTGAAVVSARVMVGYNVHPKGLAVDPIRQRLYVATPDDSRFQPTDPQFPVRSVVMVDLAGGTVGASLPMNGPTGDLAISNDGRWLYVLAADSLVRRIDTESFSVAGEFAYRSSVGGAPIRPVMPNDTIAVSPTSADTVAVYADAAGGDTTRVTVYDHGVKRPNGSSSVCCTPSNLIFAADGKALLLNATFVDGIPYDRNNSSEGTVRVAIDESGVISGQQFAFTQAGGPAALSNGIVFTTLGYLLDDRLLSPVGTFGIGGPMVVEPGGQRAYVFYSPNLLSGQPPTIRVIGFSLPDQQALGSEVIGFPPQRNLKDAAKLMRFGVDGFVIPSENGLLIFHTPLAGPAPLTTAEAVVHAATSKHGAIAPGELISIYGTNLGPAIAQGATAPSGRIPAQLGDVQVTFDRTPGTMLLSSAGQLNVVAPLNLKPGTTVSVQVLHYGLPSAKLKLDVQATAPGLFTRNGEGTGPAASINEDGRLNTPAPAGSIVTVYGTGGGLIAGSPVDGALARGAANLIAPVRVTVGGKEAQVLYAGAAPGLVHGVFQLNLRLPPDLPAGQAAITVNIGGQDSPQGATLEIR